MRGWFIVIVATLLGAGLGCAPPDADAPVVLETEDIELPAVDEVDLSTDRKAARRSRSAGALPATFPEGLPVYKPSSIVDLGELDQGAYVQFASQDEVAKVSSWYPAALERAGWSVESTAGAIIAARGGRRVRISIERSGPVSLIRVDY